MPTCKITMHKSVISLDAFNRPYDLAVRSRSILIGRFAVGLALFQGGHSTANYLLLPVSAATMFRLMPDTMPLTRRDSDSRLPRITRQDNP
jgi:hypothetical protein